MVRTFPTHSGTLAVDNLYIYNRLIGGWTKETKTGVSCSGSDGNANRILTLSNSQLTTKIILGVSGTFLHETIDYTISHLNSSSTITFLNKLWNDQNIDVTYV